MYIIFGSLNTSAVNPRSLLILFESFLSTSLLSFQICDTKLTLNFSFELSTLPGVKRIFNLNFLFKLLIAFALQIHFY
jgi:hypothetical protein